MLWQQRKKKRGGAPATWDPCTCTTAGKSMLLVMTLLLREDLSTKSVEAMALDAPDRMRCSQARRDEQLRLCSSAEENWRA